MCSEASVGRQSLFGEISTKIISEAMLLGNRVQITFMDTNIIL